jgi:hypothetical protein
MPRKRDENETAFDTIQKILRRDAKCDGTPQEPKPKARRWRAELKPVARVSAETPIKITDPEAAKDDCR